MDRSTILNHWDQFAQAPEQLAFSRIRKFPAHAGTRLAAVLGIEPTDRVLDVGCGVGILGRCLATQLEDSRQIVGVEPNATLREFSPPDSLVGSRPPAFCDARAQSLPFGADRFDVVLSHTLLNVLPGEARSEVLEEMRRVVRPGGTILGMDGVGGAHYWPSWIRGATENEQVHREFMELHRTTHEELDTGLYNTAQEMPVWFREEGLEKIDTRGWFQPCRLADDVWGEQQRIDLLDLEHRAGRKRIETLRNLLQETDRWKSEHADLLRRTSMYYQRREHRRRKAFETSQDSGWSGSATLVVGARTPGPDPPG